MRTFFSGHSSIGQYPIMTWGNEEQKQRYLPPSCRGEKILAFGLTEPDAGSNPLEMTSTYSQREAYWQLNGVKYLISNAGIATTVVVFAYPSQPAGRGRISAFIIDVDNPGLEREDLLAKMGMPTANTGMFSMTDFQAPLANLLGPEGEGFRIAMGTLVSGRLSVAAGCLGVIEDCLIESIRYAKERTQHGKAIGKHQLVQQHLTAIEMAASPPRRWCSRRRRRRTRGRRRGLGRRNCWRRRRNSMRPTPPGRPPTMPCKSSAAAAGPPSIVRAGIDGRARVPHL